MTVELHHGDCMAILPTLADGSVDAVITDPPYGVDYQSAWRTDSQRLAKIANDKRPFIWWLYRAAQVLKKGGCLLCFCRWDTAEAFRLAIRWAGLKVGAQLIWDREAHGLGDPSSRPAPQHDTIWFATRGKYTLPGKRPTSVVRSMRVGSASLEHPNQKPVGLMRELVADYVPSGGLVLDPFVGSGTTGVACVLEGRQFIGIEREERYVEIARRRTAETEAGLPITGNTLGQQSLFAAGR